MSLYDIEQLFRFVGGLGMFLFGMNAMAEGLQKSSGEKLKHMLGVLTNKRIMGVLLGALVTAIIQSSSATTVVVVGFVNAGIMNLTQAVGVIMGANIGTTVTAWIVSMGEWSSALKPEFFAPVIIGVGAFLVMFTKSKRKQELGQILVGFGILFIGLNFMSDAITPYKNAPIFATVFQTLGRNPFLGILAGAVVTGIIQSSSASVGILQTLAINGLVGWNAAVFITLGQNIGTCVTALISCAGANRTAKRAAMIHFLFNFMGAVLFGIIMYIFFLFRPGLADSNINSVQISVFHTIFNVTNTLLLFPFANLLVKLSGVLVRDKGEENQEEESIHLDERMLETPSFAMQAVRDEAGRMAELALETFKMGMEAFINNDEKLIKKVFENEQNINRYEEVLTDYIIKINNSSGAEDHRGQMKNLLYSISDLERIGDHCENLAELAQEKIKRNVQFSKDAIKDIEDIADCVRNSLTYAQAARNSYSLDDIRKVASFEEKVDALEEDLREKHIERLSNGSCGTESAVIFLDALSNLERISDHAYNIASYVKEEL